MSDELHATKTEPVLQWQTKEELQRWKRKVADEHQRLKHKEEDFKNGRKQVQSTFDVEKGKSEVKEGKCWRGSRHELGEYKDVENKVEEERVKENMEKVGATSQEVGKRLAMRCGREEKRGTASLSSPEETKLRRRMKKEEKRKVEEETRRMQEEQRIKEEIMRIKEENRKILKPNVVERDEKTSQGKEDTHTRRGRQ